MSFDFDRVAALAKMPRCGDCVNCKIIVWSCEVELKTAAKNYTIKPFGPGKTPQLAVNCGWLKHQIEAPDRIVICDGWREIPEDLQRRDGA